MDSKVPLPNFNEIPEFRSLLKDMGAEIIPIALTPQLQEEIPYKTLIALTTVGLNTSLKNINFDHESYITHKGIKIIAYHPLKTLFHIFKYFMDTSFHVAVCHHLKTERQLNSQNNYLIYAGYAELPSMTVCNDCLATINWKNYNNVNPAHKKEIVKNFNIAEFLELAQDPS